MPAIAQATQGTPATPVCSFNVFAAVAPASREHPAPRARSVCLAGPPALFRHSKGSHARGARRVQNSARSSRQERLGGPMKGGGDSKNSSRSHKDTSSGHGSVTHEASLCGFAILSASLTQCGHSNSRRSSEWTNKRLRQYSACRLYFHSSRRTDLASVVKRSLCIPRPNSRHRFTHRCAAGVISRRHSCCSRPQTWSPANLHIHLVEHRSQWLRAHVI